jgi:hypothetical protein
MGPVTLQSTISQPYTDAYAITVDSHTTSNEYIADGLTNTERIAVYGQATQLTFYSGANYNILTTYPYTDVFVAKRQGSSSEVRRSGVSQGIANMGSQQLSGFNIGNAYVVAASYVSDMRWFGMVLVNRTLTAGEISDLESYLADKSGVTL